MRSEKFVFENRGGESLAGSLDMPDGEPRAAALFAHCFTCSKDFIASRRIARHLAEAGFAVLRFDFTGLGNSAGDFANETFSSNLDDLVAAADAMRERGMAPALLVGHSLGGAAVIAAADRIAETKAVATIGAPADPGHVVHQFEERRAEIEASGEAEVTLAGRPFTIRKTFLDDIAETTLDARLAKMGRALLVLHAPRDATVGIENATRLFTGAKHSKSFVTLDDADHLLTRAGDADYAAGVIAAWAARYLPEKSAEARNEASPEKGIIATEAATSGFLTRIAAPRGRSFVADEPVAVGGTDRGPTPFELVGSGLAACTTMTMRMYAERKGWAPGAASVHVTWKQKDRHDTTFHRVITLGKGLDAAQRKRIVEIADRCPVHRMLEGEVKVTTAVTGED